MNTNEGNKSKLGWFLAALIIGAVAINGYQEYRTLPQSQEKEVAVVGKPAVTLTQAAERDRVKVQVRTVDGLDATFDVRYISDKDLTGEQVGNVNQATKRIFREYFSRYTSKEIHEGGGRVYDQLFGLTEGAMESFYKDEFDLTIRDVAYKAVNP